MAFVRSVADFEWVLNYEICLAERYRRYISLAMLQSKSPVGLKALLEGTLRNSDVYFELDASLGALLMSETDTAGSQVAIARFKDVCNGEHQLHVSAVCYPQEEVTARGMISVARERLLNSENGVEGTYAME